MRLFLRRRAVFFVPGLIFLACLATAIDASAQTNRRRSIPIPAPTATPISEPEIISRADDTDDNSNSRAIPPDPNAGADSANVVSLEELGRRIKNLEAGSTAATARKPDPDEKQKRLLLNLDILTRAEQRSESDSHTNHGFRYRWQVHAVVGQERRHSILQHAHSRPDGLRVGHRDDSGFAGHTAAQQGDD